jgi:hypothetical protein
VFDLRVICAPGDADRITAALATALICGTVRRYPSRDGLRVRLYLVADLPGALPGGQADRAGEDA